MTAQKRLLCNAMCSGYESLEQYSPYFEILRRYFVPSIDGRLCGLLGHLVYPRESPKSPLGALHAYFETTANLRQFLCADAVAQLFADVTLISNRLDRISCELDRMDIQLPELELDEALACEPLDWLKQRVACSLQSTCSILSDESFEAMHARLSRKRKASCMEVSCPLSSSSQPSNVCDVPSCSTSSGDQKKGCGAGVCGCRGRRSRDSNTVGSAKINRYGSSETRDEKLRRIVQRIKTDPQTPVRREGSTYYLKLPHDNKVLKEKRAINVPSKSPSSSPNLPSRKSDRLDNQREVSQPQDSPSCVDGPNEYVQFDFGNIKAKKCAYKPAMLLQRKHPQNVKDEMARIAERLHNRNYATKSQRRQHGGGFDQPFDNSTSSREACSDDSTRLLFDGCGKSAWSSSLDENPCLENDEIIVLKCKGSKETNARSRCGECKIDNPLFDQSCKCQIQKFSGASCCKKLTTDTCRKKSSVLTCKPKRKECLDDSVRKRCKIQKPSCSSKCEKGAQTREKRIGEDCERPKRRNSTCQLKRKECPDYSSRTNCYIEKPKCPSKCEKKARSKSRGCLCQLKKKDCMDNSKCTKCEIEKPICPSKYEKESPTCDRKVVVLGDPCESSKRRSSLCQSKRKECPVDSKCVKCKVAKPSCPNKYEKESPTCERKVVVLGDPCESPKKETCRRICSKGRLGAVNADAEIADVDDSVELTNIYVNEITLCYCDRKDESKDIGINTECIERDIKRFCKDSTTNTKCVKFKECSTQVFVKDSQHFSSCSRKTIDDDFEIMNVKFGDQGIDCDCRCNRGTNTDMKITLIEMEDEIPPSHPYCKTSLETLIREIRCSPCKSSDFACAMKTQINEIVRLNEKIRKKFTTLSESKDSCTVSVQTLRDRNSCDSIKISVKTSVVALKSSSSSNSRSRRCPKKLSSPKCPYSRVSQRGISKCVNVRESYSYQLKTSQGPDTTLKKSILREVVASLENPLLKRLQNDACVPVFVSKDKPPLIEIQKTKKPSSTPRCYNNFERGDVPRFEEVYVGNSFINSSATTRIQRSCRCSKKSNFLNYLSDHLTRETFDKCRTIICAILRRVLDKGRMLNELRKTGRVRHRCRCCHCDEDYGCCEQQQKQQNNPYCSPGVTRLFQSHDSFKTTTTSTTIRLGGGGDQVFQRNNDGGKRRKRKRRKRRTERDRRKFEAEGTSSSYCNLESSSRKGHTRYTKCRRSRRRAADGRPLKHQRVTKSRSTMDCGDSLQRQDRYARINGTVCAPNKYKTKPYDIYEASSGSLPLSGTRKCH